jgi:hypothetical protein
LALEEWVRKAGGRCWAEPGYQLCYNDNKHTDLCVALGPDRYYIDVVVSHPTSISYLPRSSRRSLVIALDADKRKRDMYEARAHAEGATLVPFSIESYGGFSPAAHKFLKALSAYANVGSTVWDSASIRDGVVGQVFAELSQGNLRAYNHEIQKSHGAPAFRRRREGSDRHHAPPVMLGCLL